MSPSPKTGIETGKLTIYDRDTVWSSWRKSGKGGAWLPVGAHVGNTGGKKGRSGRKPMVFKRMCRDLLRDPVLKLRIHEIITTGKHNDVLAAAKFLAEYTQQKPEQKMSIRTTPLEDLVAGSQTDQTVLTRE